ncbi:far upstream binding protein [Culex quinquefasciatus]|uniref:Far upstream binding protein n=1 Tax=Culex quinquefasciatus TaxID=7176 RepID=B0W743_CULQU|nr:far upstream binding protein [Culex quinquefasciatus]|eukprot:XP_001844527.1 far upstream binding protein [Culex quinquefasciatus]
MSPAAMQAAAQAAAVAARLQINNSNNTNNSNNNNSNANANPGGQDPVQRARDLISKMVNQQGGGGHNGPMDNGNHGGGGGGRGGGGGGGGGFGFTQQPYQEIMIPGSKVGLIIGKGGETIKQLQEKSGAKMVIIQDGPGQEMEKPLRISGRCPEGGARQAAVRQNNTQNGSEQAEVFVPKSAVGIVIFKGGDMIKKIQENRAQAAGSRAQVEEGKRMIEELIESVQRREQGGGGRGGRGGEREDRGDRGERPHRGGRDQHDNGNGGGYGGGGGGQDYGGPQVTREEYTFAVPVNKCGIIIGRGGDTIKQINQQSGAHTEMDRKASANQTTEKTFTCKGEPHQIEEAKRLIQDKINMEINMQYVGSSTGPAQQYQNNGGGGGQGGYGQSWGGGGGGGYGQQQQSWDQQQPSQPGAPSAPGPQQPGQAGGAGQADYSQQWIEYYRQMGMHREAEMIEQQVKARQAAAQQEHPQQRSKPPKVISNKTCSGNNGNERTLGTSVVAASNAGPQQAAAGGGPQGGGGSGGQADYSAEWAEYYRRLGRVEEAEAIEKQIAHNKALQGQGGGAGGPAGGAGGNPQLAAQQAAAAAGYGAAAAQQYQQYYAGAAAAAAAGGQPGGGYQGYPYGGGYPGGQQGGQDKN